MLAEGPGGLPGGGAAPLRGSGRTPHLPTDGDAALKEHLPRAGVWPLIAEPRKLASTQAIKTSVQQLLTGHLSHM